jgi:adenylate kinase
MLSIIVGVSGVGKSTIIEEVKNSKDNLEFKNLNYGDVMLEIAKERGLADNRDELTEIPSEKYDEIQEEVPRRLNEKSQDKLVVLDTHSSLNTPTGFRPGIPQDTVKVLEPDNITIIRAEASEIRSRREEDESRERDILPIEDIEQHQEMEIRMGCSSGVISGCPVEIIDNNDGNLREAASDYGDILSKLV